MNLFVNPVVINKTIDLSVRIFEFAQCYYGRNYELKAWSNFFDGDPSEYPSGPYAMEIFIPWYIYKWQDEDENIAFEYLMENYSTLGEIEKIFISSCIQGSFSFYQVQEVEKNRYVELKDLISKETFLCFDKKASKYLKQKDIIFAKLASIYDLNFIVSCTSIIYPQNYSEEIAKFASQKKIRNDELSRMALNFNLLAEILKTDLQPTH